MKAMQGSIAKLLELELETRNPCLHGYGDRGLDQFAEPLSTKLGHDRENPYITALLPKSAVIMDFSTGGVDDR